MTSKTPKNQTLRYYDEHADEFIAGTINADMTEFHNRFLALLKPSSCIMDLGCGSGRDSLAFLRRGYRVLPVEPSEALAKKAEKLLKIPVRRHTAQEIPDVDKFSGIWANASLLHLNEGEMAKALQRITRALKSNGVFFVSLKHGQGEQWINGRFFKFYTEESFRQIIDQSPELDLNEIWQTQDVRPERHQTWLNAILVRSA